MESLSDSFTPSVQDDRDDMDVMMDDDGECRCLLGWLGAFERCSGPDDLWCLSVSERDDLPRRDNGQRSVKKIVYPPRLMVDFKSLGVRGL